LRAPVLNACSVSHSKYTDIMEKDHEDNKDLPIQSRPKGVTEEQIKKSWDAIYKAITEVEEKKSGAKKKTPTKS